MPVAPAVESEPLPIPTDPVSFVELLAQLYADRYTGAVLLHFANGRPKKAERATTAPAVLVRGDGVQLKIL